jgi:hypothetical protein
LRFILRFGTNAPKARWRPFYFGWHDDPESRAAVRSGTGERERECTTDGVA